MGCPCSAVDVPGFNFPLKKATSGRTCLKGPLNSAPNYLPIYMPKKPKGVQLCGLGGQFAFSQAGADPEIIVTGGRRKGEVQAWLTL